MQHGIDVTKALSTADANNEGAIEETKTMTFKKRSRAKKRN